MVTLSRIAEALGPSIISVLAAPAGLDRQVRDVVIYDPQDQAGWAPGDLVLGVGVTGDAAVLLGDLAVAGAAALVAKTEGPVDSSSLVAEADRCGLALLAIPRSASWAQVLVLLRSLLFDADDSDASTVAAAAPGDLVAAANMVAAMVGAPITIEDPQSRVLAFSARQDNTDAARTATILGQRVPDAYRQELRRMGITKRLLTEAHPIFVGGELIDGIRPRVVIALRAGNEIVGSMWAVSDEPFDDRRNAAFTDAARYVAMQLLHNRLSRDIHRQHQSELLRAVLDGGTAGISAARSLGLHGDGFRVIAAGVRAGDDIEDRAVLSSGWQFLTMHLSTHHRGAASAQLGDTLLVVLPDNASAGMSRAQRLADALVAHVGERSGGRFVVAIGGRSTSLAEIPRSRRQADEVLRVLRAGASTKLVASVDDVRVQVVMQRLADLEAADPVGESRQLDTIARYDATHSTRYLETLRAYLNSFGDPASASSRLNIHTNTLRYRLRRIGELFDLDLSDEDVRLGLLLQFRLGAG